VADTALRHLGQGRARGHAARAGVTSVLLAKKGYFAASDVIEGDYGFFSAFHAGELRSWQGGQTDWARTGRSSIPGLTVKRYPCCGGNLRALDAAQGLIQEHGIKCDGSRSWKWTSMRTCCALVRFTSPRGVFEGKFSIDYVLAAMLLDGRVGSRFIADDLLQRGRACVRHWRKCRSTPTRTGLTTTRRAASRRSRSR